MSGRDNARSSPRCGPGRLCRVPQRAVLWYVSACACLRACLLASFASGGGMHFIAALPVLQPCECRVNAPVAGGASVSGTLCGGDSVYCPAGSSAPLAVAVGFYSVGDLGQRAGEQVCPTGKFCVSGVASDCPAGRFGDTTGLASSECSGPCADGTYARAQCRWTTFHGVVGNACHAVLVVSRVLLSQGLIVCVRTAL